MNARALGLQAKHECVVYASEQPKVAGASTPTMRSGVDVLTKAAAAIDQLITSNDSLSTELARKEKFAAALIDAVKLAQDGMIDISEVLDVAQADAAKLASFTTRVEVSSAGELADEANPVSGLDPLTAFLRQRR